MSLLKRLAVSGTAYEVFQFCIRLPSLFSIPEFFENLAFEAKIDADKSVMIKNSIHARKKMVQRAKTMKFETARKRRTKGNIQHLYTITCEP